jgi:hypothetical protein
MTAPKLFADPNERRIKVTTEFTNDPTSSLHIKINPRQFFYPYIVVQPNDIYFEDDGISYEVFSRHKTIINMLKENAYKEIFKQRLAYGLDNFLYAVQAEAKFEFEKGESLEKKVVQNEDTIFDLIKKKGPWIFRHNAVIGKIQEWCGERDMAKIERLITELRKYGKKLRGSINLSSLDNRCYCMLNYYSILNTIRSLKKEITAKRKVIKDVRKLENEIKKTWAKKLATQTLIGKPWFELLIKWAKREEEKNETRFIPFIRENSPRELTIGVFSEVLNLARDTIDKILRNRNDIIKNMSVRDDVFGGAFLWDLDAS